MTFCSPQPARPLPDRGCLPRSKSVSAPRAPRLSACAVISGRLAVALAVAGLALCLAGPSAAQRLAVPAAALESARDWLKLLDAGSYDQSWTRAGVGFREGMSKAEWLRRIKTARGKLGKNVRREPIDVRRAGPDEQGGLSGSDGDCLVILFGASYARVAYTTETLTMCREGKEWRVAGYFIR